MKKVDAVSKPKRIAIFAMVLMILILAYPQQALAYEAKYLGVFVNPYAHTYEGQIMTADAAMKATQPEYKSASISEIKGTGVGGIGNSTLIQMETSKMPESEFKTAVIEWATAKNGEEIISDLPFTFPSGKVGDGDTIPKVDSKMAKKTKDVLIESLNGALLLVYGESSTDLQLFERTKELLNAIDRNGTANGWDVQKGKSGKTTYKADNDGSYVTFSKEDKSVSFVYALKKDTAYNPKESTTLTWEMAVVEAWMHYAKGYTSEETDGIISLSFMERSIASLLSGVINGLDSILGLDSPDELIFNEGERGDENHYLYGGIKIAWLEKADTLFFLTNAIAISLFIFAIAQTVLRRNLGVLSGGMSASIMEDVEKLFLAGALLTLTTPIFLEILKFSYLLTDVFKGILNADAASRYLTDLAFAGNGLASVVSAVVLFSLTCYLNIMYVIRDVMLMVLWVLSPIFVMTLTMGERMTKVFTGWVGAVISTIVIQPIHALILSLLFCVPVTTVSGIEGICYIGALVPVTEAIRHLFFNNSGNQLVMATKGVSAAGKAAYRSSAMALGGSTVRNLWGVDRHRQDAKRQGLQEKQLDVTKARDAIKAEQGDKRNEIMERQSFAERTSALSADSKQRVAQMKTHSQQWSQFNSDGKRNQSFDFLMNRCNTETQGKILSSEELYSSQKQRNEALGTVSNTKWNKMSLDERQSYCNDVMLPRAESYFERPNTPQYNIGSENLSRYTEQIN